MGKKLYIFSAKSETKQRCPLHQLLFNAILEYIYTHTYPKIDNITKQERNATKMRKEKVKLLFEIV